MSWKLVALLFSLIWPFPRRYRHSPWPVDVTELFPRFCCWTLISLSRHWAWLRRGYWRYRSLIDWLIDWFSDSGTLDLITWQILNLKLLLIRKCVILRTILGVDKTSLTDIQKFEVLYLFFVRVLHLKKIYFIGLLFGKCFPDCFPGCFSAVAAWVSLEDCTVFHGTQHYSESAPCGSDARLRPPFPSIQWHLSIKAIVLYCSALARNQSCRCPLYLVGRAWNDLTTITIHQVDFILLKRSQHAPELYCSGNCCGAEAAIVGGIWDIYWCIILFNEMTLHLYY